MKLVEGKFFPVLVWENLNWKKFPLQEKVFYTHLMRCSGLGKVVLEKIPLLSEHVGLFGCDRHVEIREPVKLFLRNKIYESKLFYKMDFGGFLSFVCDMMWIMIGCQRKRSRDGQFNHPPFLSSSPAGPPTADQS